MKQDIAERLAQAVPHHAVLAPDLDLLAKPLPPVGERLRFQEAEPVLGEDSAFAAVTQDISRANDVFQKGYPTLVPIPPLTKPTLVGLYVCKDSSNRKSCRTKPAEKINNILLRTRYLSLGLNGIFKYVL